MSKNSPTGYPDTPVEKPEDDLFNVTTYVNGLCSFIGSCETPMTISIQGDWGSGKTSMMNMIRSKLQDTTVPIWFNTWQFSQFDMGNSLAFSMMDVLLKGLDCDKEYRKKILSALAGFGRKTLQVVTDHAIGGAFSESVKEVVDPTGSTDVASEIVELKEKFQEAINQTLSKHPGRNRVVIFVDDLDRLQPARAVELLEVLKLFLDCQSCVFILAVDYEVVTLGIRQKYGSEVTAEKGRSFFDKIIQLPFKMPVAQYDIKKYIISMLRRQNIEANDQESDLFVHLIQTSIGFNPRSMKRLFNTFQLLDIITAGAVRSIPEKIRERILFAIICLQMSYERFYQYLASAKTIKAELFQTLADPEQAGDEIKTLMEAGTDDASRDVDKAVRRLSRFMGYFIKALQIDNDENLSDEELENLSHILKCSLVTSVSGEDEDLSRDQDLEWRYANKEYAKTLQNYLSNLPVGENAVNKIWMPRKANPEEGVRLSDISWYYSWRQKPDTSVNFDCAFSRENDYTINIHFYITCWNKKEMNWFHEKLGDNPLELSTTPEWLSWGRYQYMKVHQFNENDYNALKQIADQIRILIQLIQNKLEDDSER